MSLLAGQRRSALIQNWPKNFISSLMNPDPTIRLGLFGVVLPMSYRCPPTGSESRNNALPTKKATGSRWPLTSVNPLFPSGAEGETRTPTGRSPHGPEPCASANSATPAWRRQIIENRVRLVNPAAKKALHHQLFGLPGSLRRRQMAAADGVRNFP